MSVNEYTTDLSKLSIKAAPSGRGAPSLGTTAKYVSTFPKPLDSSSPSRLCERFALQSAARQLMPNERVSVCLRRPIPGANSIDLLHDPKNKKGIYKNLQVCSSVWMCPVCAAKITEKRRLELQKGLDNWDRRGPVFLVTFTLQHEVNDSLSSILGGLLKSYRALRAGRWWQDFEARYSLQGSIKSLEVTYGLNGWHPHLHVLMFFSGSVQLDQVASDLKARWLSQLDKNSLSASWRRGVDVRSSNSAIADYIAKFGRESDWTLAHEMTKAPVKKARVNSGRSMLQLLADYLGGDQQAGAIWSEYAREFKGRRQLFWSPGLRSLLGLVQEKTDEELVIEVENMAILLASLTLAEWRQVLKLELRAVLLELAATGHPDQVQIFLAGIGIRGQAQLKNMGLLRVAPLTLLPFREESEGG